MSLAQCGATSAHQACGTSPSTASVSCALQGATDMRCGLILLCGLHSSCATAGLLPKAESRAC